MSVRDRILFPIKDHSVADANNVSGVRRRLQERNVAAGDLLIVTNTYRSANYVDHEGKPRDVYDFDRKFFINHDTLFTVEQVVDEGDRLVLGVVEYPGGGMLTWMCLLLVWMVRVFIRRMVRSWIGVTLCMCLVWSLS